MSTSTPSVSAQIPLSQKGMFEYAAGLIAYARGDEEYAQYLAQKVTATCGVAHDSDVQVAYEQLSPWLIPRTAAVARARTNWLMSEVLRRQSDAVGVVPMLRAWVSRREMTDPKDVVFGIVGLAIIGPTLGLIKKKVFDTMVVVVSRELLTQPLTVRIESVVSVSTGLAADALRAVSGEAYRLEPSLADWFFGERKLSIYVTSSRELTLLADSLENAGLPHAQKRTADTLCAVGISPSVAPEILQNMEVTQIDDI